MSAVTVVCYSGLAVAALLAVWRLCLGPTVPDRIVALDNLLYVVVIGIAVAAAATGDGSFLGVLLAVSLLAFVGTTTVARFVERRGGRRVMDDVLEVLSAALLLGGVALAVVAGVGLLRFPDVFSRMHAATKPATLGLLMVCLGAGLVMEDGADRAKLALVAVFQFLTAPVAAHMIGRAAYRAGEGDLEGLAVDDLRDAGPDAPDGRTADPA